MAVDLVEGIDITITHVVIKFGVSLQQASIKNECFTVFTDEATPVQIGAPFVTINLLEDYNTVSRGLELTWNEDALEPDTEYTLTISGLKNVIGQTLEDWVVEFSTGAQVNDPLDGLPPAATPVSIIDYSIVSSAYDTMIINPETQGFRVVSSDPELGDYYLPPDYNDGRVEIVFSQAPATSSVTVRNFKAQRRLITRGPTRWENVDVELSQHNKTVYVDFPSIDHYPETATPATDVVYNTSGYEYFSENYKYRIIASKDIST